MHLRLLLRFVAVLSALTVAFPAMAVDLNGTIKGVVTDQDGLSVPGVELTLSSPDLQGDRETTSDADGRYRFTPLPPGVYLVTATKKGFSDWTSAELKIPVAATARVDIVLLPQGAAATEIDVIDQAPAVDTEKVFSGAVLDAEFLKDIPSGRSYQSATSLAPGVVGGGNANVRGSFYSSNQFYIDGVNITDPITNTFSTNMNYDAIDSLQILTGGMDAEYGRSLGGAINIVTKSGGNQFEGHAQLTYFQGPSMVLAPQIEDYGDQFDSNLEQQLVLNLGGPILKDKVWFFTSFQGDRLIRSFSFDADEVGRDLDLYPQSPRDWRSLYWFTKVTAQPAMNHRIWTQIQGDPTWIDNVDQSPYTLPSAEQIQNQGGWLGSIGHQWTPKENLLIETQLYTQRSYIDYFSVLWNHCQQFDADGSCAHSFVGMDYEGQPVTESWFGWGSRDFNSGEFPYASFNDRRRSSVTTSLTWIGDFLGEHTAKVGFQAERLRSIEVWPGLSENAFPYYTYNEDLDPEGIGPMNLDAYVPQQLYVYDNDLALDFTGGLMSWYVQDVYKPHRRLTLRPGLRFDRSNMRNEDDQTTAAIEKPESIYNSLTVAPRLGLAYDLTGDNKTALHAYYGRFYDSGFLILSALLQRTSQGITGYPWDPDAGDWDYENPNYSVAGSFLSHKLQNPYSDEFDIGIAREIGPGMAIDVNFTYEESRRFWEDDEVNLIWNDDGSAVIGYRNGVNQSVFRLRTPDDTYTKYTSIETTLSKQYTDNWAFLGSYTWSRAYGTNSRDQATANADIPEQRPLEIGLLSYNRTHAIKFAGSYTEQSVARIATSDLGYVLGWNFQMYSGTPYRPLVFNNYYGSYANYNDYGDGRYTLPTFSQLDIRAGLNVNVADRMTWMIGADVFNVFNDRTITSVATAYDPEDSLDEAAFGSVLDRQDPRRLQITIRGTF